MASRFPGGPKTRRRFQSTATAHGTSTEGPRQTTLPHRAASYLTPSNGLHNSLHRMRKHVTGSRKRLPRAHTEVEVQRTGNTPMENRPSHLHSIDSSPPIHKLHQSLRKNSGFLRPLPRRPCRHALQVKVRFPLACSRTEELEAANGPRHEGQQFLQGCRHFPQNVTPGLEAYQPRLALIGPNLMPMTC